MEHEMYLLFVEILKVSQETNEIVKTMYNKLQEAEAKAKPKEDKK